MTNFIQINQKSRQKVWWYFTNAIYR